MDLRVIGGGAAAVAFGMGGFTYVSMDEVLSADIRAVHTVPAGELQSYMDGVVGKPAAGYGYYAVETETLVFVGELSFEADARTRTFTETTRSEDPVSASDRKAVRAEYLSWNYCDSEDALMFTDKGYTYDVIMRDGAGELIVRETCRATNAPQLRGASSV